MKTFLSFLIIGLLTASSGALANDSDKSKDKVKVKVLNKTSSRDCAYIGDTAFRVTFQIKAEGVSAGRLILSGSKDGKVYSDILTKDFEGMRGTSTLLFDAGACLKDAQVRLEHVD